MKALTDTPLVRLPRIFAGSLAKRVRALRDLRRQRARLGALDDHLLRDIGLTRDAADRESRRPLWDAPAYWFDRRP